MALSDNELGHFDVKQLFFGIWEMAVSDNELGHFDVSVLTNNYSLELGKWHYQIMGWGTSMSVF